jgi:benzoylformate decarboxylase
MLAELQRKEKDAYRARVEKGWDREPSSMPRVTAELRRGLPDDVVIVDESITASLDLARAFDYRGFGDYFGGRGVGIGQGLAGAIGVKVAMPDRPVVAISGDGSAMYAIQALWTAAHHKLAIVFVVLANREYRILKHNVDVWRQNFEASTQHPYQNMDITGPALDFVHLAAGMGVEAVRVEKADEIAAAVAKAVATRRPYLVEIAIEGKR